MQFARASRLSSTFATRVLDTRMLDLAERGVIEPPDRNISRLWSEQPSWLYGIGVLVPRRGFLAAVLPDPFAQAFLDAHPFLLVDQSIAPRGAEPWMRSEASGALRELRTPPPPEFLVLGVPPPQLQVGCGEGINCGMALGVLGAWATSQDGNVALLTAGHVVTEGGSSTVSQHGSTIGKVSFCEDPAVAATGGPCADVAVIDLQAVPAAATGTQILGRATPIVRTPVTVHGATQQRSEFLASLDLFHPPSLQGAYTRLLMTDDDISQSGDSGAPAVNDNDQVVGIVIGGSPGQTTYIQDIDYVLARAGATWRPGP